MFFSCCSTLNKCCVESNIHLEQICNKNSFPMQLHFSLNWFGGNRCLRVEWFVQSIILSASFLKLCLFVNIACHGNDGYWDALWVWWRRDVLRSESFGINRRGHSWNGLISGLRSHCWTQTWARIFFFLCGFSLDGSLQMCQMFRLLNNMLCFILVQWTHNRGSEDVSYSI